MSDCDLISVIMSAYNEDPAWIMESVDSILNQSYPNFEFVIVLDKPDNLVLKEMLEAYQKKDSRIRLLVNDKNEGLVRSLNAALIHCAGHYIARMDADDISLLNRLELQKRYLEANKLDFVFSGVYVIDERGDRLHGSNDCPMGPEKVKRLLRITNCTYHPTWFVKTEIFKRLNGYREVNYCEDYDFSLRTIDAGYKVGKMDTNVLDYRVRSTSISRSNRLEQFLNMKGILELYTRKKLHEPDAVAEMLNNSRRVATEKAKEKFDKGDRLYSTAVRSWKRKAIVHSISNIAMSCLVSRFHIVKYKDMISYKLSARSDHY